MGSLFSNHRSNFDETCSHIDVVFGLQLQLAQLGVTIKNAVPLTLNHQKYNITKLISYKNKFVVHIIYNIIETLGQPTITLTVWGK